MTHRGSCHCGRVAFEVDGDVEQVIECNCSHCDRKGFLLWFVPRSNFRLTSGVDDLRAYTFNKHVIQHQFCTTCGTQAFAFGKDRNGNIRTRVAYSYRARGVRAPGGGKPAGRPASAKDAA